MNKFTMSAIVAALTLSGCSSMMYGDSVAPVVSLNAPVGQQPMVRPQGAIVQPIGGYKGQVAHQGQQSMAQPYNQAMNQPINAQQLPLTPQQTISPYQPVTGNQAGVGAGDDGWSVSPGKSTQNNAQPAVAQLDQSQAVRPQMVDEPKVTPTEPNNSVASSSEKPAAQDTTAASKQSDNNQVASVATPAQPSQSQPEDNAISTLLQKASASLGKGDFDGAAAYLENAQRIEPQNAKILYDIANIRYHQGRYREAESFASRAVQVGGNNATMKKTWALIANARKSLGDNQGAITAAEKAASL